MKKSFNKTFLILFLGTLSFHFSFGQDYCSVSATSTGNEFISEFIFSNITNTTGDNGYTNYSATKSIIVYPGANYQPQVTLTKSYSSDLLSCWIDWNQNKTFEVTEKYNFTIIAGVGTASISVPMGATLGKARLRLMLKGSSSIDPCTSFRYGEVEDYEVDLQQVTFPPTANFNADNFKPFVGQTVNLTDKSSALPTDWLWEITPNTFEFINSSAASQNPAVKFLQAGLYSVTLKATNGFGFDDTTRVDYINVCNYPVARSLTAKTEGSWVDLSWNGPNISGYKYYIDYESATMLMWESPERATLFRARDFNLFYPITISKIEHGFFKHASYPWPSDEFKFKIYDEDGTTLLYESGVLHAPIANGITHDLSSPLVLNKDFYVAICPIDLSGHPSSLMKDIIGSENHTYLLKEGVWQLMKDGSVGYEIQTSVYAEGSKGDNMLSYINDDKSIGTSSKDGQLASIGYKVYRDNNLIKTINSNTTVSYRDSLAPDGLHSYCVKSTFQNPDGESLPSNIVDITVNNSLPEIHTTILGKRFESGSSFFIPKNVMIAENYVINVEVSNSGNSTPLNIGAVTIDNSEFVVTQALPTQIPANSSSTMIIQFTPTSNGDKTANLSIVTNDSNENPFTLAFTAVAGPVEWTWMVYMLEDYTQLDGEKDVNEWEINGSVPGKVNYIVFWDAQDDAKDGIWLVKKDPTGIVNYELYSEKISSEFGIDFDMSKYLTLQNFLLWAAQKYPAQHYGLAMWDHGSGIFKSGGIDKGVTKDFCGGMKLWEMEKAVNAFTTQVGKKIDIIGFDVCLLGQIETAYQLAPYCDYVIASPKTEPGDGWDYDAGFKPLNQNPKMDIADFAKNIVYTYIDAYKTGGSAYPAVATQAATSTAELMQNVIPSLNTFSTELKNWVYYFKPQIKSARDNAWVAPGQQGDDNPDHRDLMGFAKNLMNNYSLPTSLHNAAADLVSKLTVAIIANANNGTSASESNGLKIFIPNDITTQGTSQTFYMDAAHYLKFSNTQWDEFLFMFANPTAVNEPSFVKPQNLTAQVQDGNDVLVSWEKPIINSEGETLLSQGFEGSSWPPVGWEVLHGVNADGSGLSAPTGTTWIHCNVGTFGSNPNPEQYMHSGVYSAAISYTATDLNWLITPEVTIESDYDLYYWMWFANDNDYHTNFYVKVLNDGVCSTLKQYDSNSPSNLYDAEESVDLYSYVGKTVRIAFVYEYTDGFQLALDDIRIAKVSKGGSKANSNFTVKKCLPVSGLLNSNDSNKESESMGIWVSYKIYRNGTLVNTIEDINLTSWKDENVPDGSYSYEVSANYITPSGESAKCGPAAVIINQTDVEENGFSTIVKVYPNPSRGSFSVIVDGLNSFEWTLSNIGGSTVEYGKSDVSVLHFSGIKPGVYLLMVRNKKSSNSFKLVVL